MDAGPENMLHRDDCQVDLPCSSACFPFVERAISRRAKYRTRDRSPSLVRASVAPKRLRVLSRLRGSLPQRTLPAFQLTAFAAGGSPGHPRFARDPLRRATRSSSRALLQSTGFALSYAFFKCGTSHAE